MRFHSGPLLPFTVVFIIGILLHDCGWAELWLTLLLCVVGGGFFMIRKPYAGLMCCGILLGYAVSAANEPAPFPEGIEGRELDYSGVVMEIRHLDPSQVMVVKVDSCIGKECRPFLVKLTTPSSLPSVEERDRIDFTASVSPLAFEPDLPGETDYDRPLRLMGVVGQTFVRPDSLNVSGLEPGMMNAIRRFRTDVTLAIVDLPVSNGCKEFLNAVLTGDRSMLTPDMQELFSTTGLSHLLALSGLHVAIIAGLISILLFPLALVRRGRILRGVVVVTLLWLFAIMTGLGPSVVRSVLMVTLFFIAYSLQRQRSPFNSLCVAALIILVCDPNSLYAIGFQLSFLAVGSILLFAEPFNPFPQRQTLLHGIAAYPAVTLAAMMGTAVVSAYYFNVFPLVFLPVNFVAALLIPFVLAGGVVITLFSLVGLTVPFLPGMVDWLFSLLQGSAAWFGSFSWTAVKDVDVSVPTLLAWFVTLIPLALWFYRRRIVYLTASLLCLAFTFVTVIASERPDEIVEVYIPRSKHHTSIMVRDGGTLHVVTSAPERIHGELCAEYRRKYSRYMLSRGIDSIHVVTPGRHAVEPLEVCGRRYVLIHDARQISDSDEGSGDHSDSGVHLDYAVICSGFRGDINALAEKLDVDSILLSADMNTRRHDRYFSELSEAGRNVRSLRRSPFGWRTESVDLMD